MSYTDLMLFEQIKDIIAAAESRIQNSGKAPKRALAAHLERLRRIRDSYKAQIEFDKKRTLPLHLGARRYKTREPTTIAK